MNTRNLKVIALALPLLIGTAACGGSDDSAAPPPAVVSNNDPANTATPAGDSATPESNDAVEAYCTEVDDFVEASKKLLTDPTSVDMDALTKQGLELATAATALVTSATGDDAARLQECSAKFADVGT